MDPKYNAHIVGITKAPADQVRNRLGGLGPAVLDKRKVSNIRSTISRLLRNHPQWAIIPWLDMTRLLRRQLHPRLCIIILRHDACRSLLRISRMVPRTLSGSCRRALTVRRRLDRQCPPRRPRDHQQGVLIEVRDFHYFKVCLYLLILTSQRNLACYRSDPSLSRRPRLLTVKMWMKMSLTMSRTPSRTGGIEGMMHF